MSKNKNLEKNIENSLKESSDKVFNEKSKSTYKKRIKKASDKTSNNKIGLIRLICYLQKLEPAFFPLVIIENIFASTIPFINIYLSARIIDGITIGETREELISRALLMILLNMFIALIRWAIDKIIIVLRVNIYNKNDLEVIKKALYMDYQVMEKEGTLDYIQMAADGSNYMGGISSLAQNLGESIQHIVMIIYSAVALINFLLIKSDVSKNAFVNSGLYIIILIAAMIFTAFITIHNIMENSMFRSSVFQDSVSSNRKFGWFFSLINNYKYGQQTRIYDMYDFLDNFSEEFKKETGNHWRRIFKSQLKTNNHLRVVTTLMMCLLYIFIGMKVYSGAVTIGSLTFYTGMFTSFMGAVSGIGFMLGSVKQQTFYLGNYIKFLELKNEKYDGTIPVEKRLDNEYELEFRNVSFHYPNSDKPVLKNISTKIKVGGKMAIVGRNGSGKSTFIKLLCRLYDPTEGEILLNGIDIKKYDYDEYRDLFGVVFQDFNLFSFSIAQNVAAGVNYNKEKVMKCLEQAGMSERISEFKHGIEEEIYKINGDGVEISGGEAQKIAIARALYKDAPVVILDEPTAALDPVSELEIYEKFDKMVDEKTAIYISHRMSSCRFCENILVFNDGKIEQMGSHEELYDAKEGIYHEMWDAQAQYYNEG